MTASDDLWLGIEELREARPAYVTACEFYENQRPEIFSSIRVRRAIARAGAGFGLNFIATVVDAVVDRLQLAAVTSPDRDQAAALQTVWDNNLMQLESAEVHRKASEFGDCYVIVLPRYDDGAPDNAPPAGVDIYCNDPLTVRVIYDPENPRRKLFTIKRWVDSVLKGNTTVPVHRAELYYDDRTERWTTRPGSAGDTPADWMPWLPAAEVTSDGQIVEPDDDAWILDNPWGEQPVFHFRNDRPYGRAEHERGFGAQNAINKLIATHMSTVDYQGFPQRYALTDTAGTDTGDLDPADFDDDFFPPDPNSGPTDIGDESALKAGPGEVWTLRGFKQVGQFEAAQPAVFFDPVEFNVRAMAHCTTTPLHLFDPSGEKPSGESVRAQDAPFTRKVRERQTAYGGVWQDVFAFALHLLQVEEPLVDVRWHAAETIDDKDSWTTAKAKSELGVPQRQLLIEAGYSEDQVDQWLAEPTDDPAELSRRLADLATLSDTLEKLGTAVTLGAIDQGQVQQLITPVIDAMTARPALPPGTSG